MDFTYGFNAGTNNGDITSWSAAGNQTFSRTYTYDSLNRIATMADSASSQPCKGLSWTIDPWGNRIEIVGYDNIQFTKAPYVLRGMGLSNLSKSDKAIKEFADKGMVPD